MADADRRRSHLQSNAPVHWGSFLLSADRDRRLGESSKLAQFSSDDEKLRLRLRRSPPGPPQIPALAGDRNFSANHFILEKQIGRSAVSVSLQCLLGRWLGFRAFFRPQTTRWLAVHQWHLDQS